MPQPTYAQVHVDTFLTNMSVAMMQDPNNFIADKVFPIVPVTKQSDLYVIYDMDDFNRDEAQIRAPATESVGGGYNLSRDSYRCEKYAYHKDVTEEDRVNSDSPLNADRDATEFVTQKLLLMRERMWKDHFFKTGVWGKDWAGVTGVPIADQFKRWDEATSQPIKDVKAAQMYVGALTGLKLNTLIMSPPIRAALDDNADVLERIQYGGTPGSPAVITNSALAQVFDVENVYVPWGIINSGKEGLASSVNFIYGKHALLCYTIPNPGTKKACAGKIFAWAGLLGGSAYGSRVNRIDMPKLGIGTQRIECEMAFAMKAISSVLGLFLENAVS